MVHKSAKVGSNKVQNLSVFVWLEGEQYLELVNVEGLWIIFERLVRGFFF